jgi:hypothetical protein
MSIQVVSYLRCDGCRRAGSDGCSSRQAARAEGKRRGWKRVPRGPGAPMGGRGGDYCPSCARNRGIE